MPATDIDKSPSAKRHVLSQRSSPHGDVIGTYVTLKASCRLAMSLTAAWTHRSTTLTTSAKSWTTCLVYDDSFPEHVARVGKCELVHARTASPSARPSLSLRNPKSTTAVSFSTVKVARWMTRRQPPFNNFPSRPTAPTSVRSWD